MRFPAPLYLLLPLLLVLVPSTSSAEGDTVSVAPIRDGLFMLQGRGGNLLASIGGDGLLLVDSDYGDMHEAQAGALAGLGQHPLRFLINTHWHGDHTGANAAWARAGAVVMAHDNVRRRMSTDQNSPVLGVVAASPAEAWPIVTFESSLALHFNGQTVEVQHYPRGHTDGDSVVFFQPSNVVHLGDHMFNGRFPFVDISSGGNVENLTRNIAALIQLVDEKTVIVPGHGPLANKADLQAYHNMLINTRAEVKEMQADGLSLEQMQARGLDGRWKSWEWGFINQDRWIAILASE